MRESASSLSWRPINLDHSGQWLPFPRNRVDTSVFEDMCIEAVIRIDNREKHVQDMLDSKAIIHPSIECRKWTDGRLTFMAMALLRRGKMIPGDPLSEIHPLFMEAVDFTSQLDYRTLNLTENSERNKLLEIVHQQSITISELKEAVSHQQKELSRARRNFRKLKAIAKNYSEKLSENMIVDIDGSYNIIDYNKSIQEISESTDDSLREPLREEIKEVNEIITQVFQLAEGIPAEEIEENIERMVKETVNVFRDILDLAV